MGWLYTFWFPEKSMAQDFAQEFNRQFGTSILNLRSGADYSQDFLSEIEEPAYTSNDDWHLITLGVTQEELDQDWYLEIKASHQLHDLKFDDLAAVYEGEYQGTGQDPNSIQRNPFTCDLCPVCHRRHNPKGPRRKPGETPQELARIRRVIESFGFIRHPKRRGFYVEPRSGRMVRFRNLRRWAQESLDLEKRIRDELSPYWDRDSEARF